LFITIISWQSLAVCFESVGLAVLRASVCPYRCPTCLTPAWAQEQEHVGDLLLKREEDELRKVKDLAQRLYDQEYK
jgi:organic radical activating enzyme